VLSRRGLCEELITRPEESYRLCCVAVCDPETSRIGAPYIYDISHLRVNEIGWEDVVWTDLTQMRDKRQAAMNSVLILWVTQRVNIRWLADELSTIQEQLCSRELVDWSV
jgi:hypothetical protein